jgi:3'-phosphoadenosine 5'-phosphosulfate sulfotransferase (PAPS reductase)/FAD synthetase
MRRRNSWEDLPATFGPAPSSPQPAPYWCQQCGRQVFPEHGVLPPACSFCDEPVVPGAATAAPPRTYAIPQAAPTAPLPGPVGGRPIAEIPQPLVAPDLRSYDYVIVAFSGGKDSLAALLHTLDLARSQGRDLVRDRALELWHHDVDSPESGQFMDWPVTTPYVRALGAALGIPVYFSWKVGGFLRELMKTQERTASSKWEEPGGVVGESGGERGKVATRRMWPAQTSDLQKRWCSPTLKIEVMDKAIANQARFKGRRVLVVTGERAEEAPVTETAFPTTIRGVVHAGTRGAKKSGPVTKCGIAFKQIPDERPPFGWWYAVTCDECHRKLGRAGYAAFEEHRSHSPGPRAQRHVDHWRPVHHWSTPQVWEEIRRYGVVPHPAYRAGLGRVSCAFCIFGSPDQWATLRDMMPTGFERIAQLEEELGHTISHEETVRERAARGQAYAILSADVDEGRRLAVQPRYDAPILVRPENWILPAGAYAEAAGPT